MSASKVNPFLEFRKEQKKSIKQLADMLQVSESTYIRTEQGLYHDIPPVLLRNFSNHTLSPDLVRAQYVRSQIRQRAATFESGRLRRDYLKRLKTLITDAPHTSPFLIWRVYVQDIDSRLTFCKMTCLHPSTVKRVEDGIAGTVPSSIIDALEQCGIDPHPLAREYEKWKMRIFSPTK
jgi:hypothetical protein